MKALASLTLLGFLLASCGDSKDSKDDQQNSPVVVKDDESLNSEIPANPSPATDAPKEEAKEESKKAEEKEPKEGRGRRPRKPAPKPFEENLPIPDAQVGRGFETTTGNQMQHCLGGTISKDTADSYSSSSFENVVTFQDVASLVLRGSSESADTFFTELDRNNGFFKVETDTELTATYKFASVYVLGTKHIDNTKYRVDTANLDLFRKKCGNKYISSAKVGGVYGASVKLFFANEEVAKLVGSNYRFATLTQELLEARVKLSQEQLSQVEVEISTMQVGGGEVSNPQIPTGKALRCAMADLSECLDVVNAIGEYGRKGFRNAIETSPATLSIQVNPYPL